MDEFRSEPETALMKRFGERDDTLADRLTARLAIETALAAARDGPDDLDEVEAVALEIAIAADAKARAEALSGVRPRRASGDDGRPRRASRTTDVGRGQAQGGGGRGRQGARRAGPARGRASHLRAPCGVKTPKGRGRHHDERCGRGHDESTEGTVHQGIGGRRRRRRKSSSVRRPPRQPFIFTTF